MLEPLLQDMRILSATFAANYSTFNVSKFSKKIMQLASIIFIFSYIYNIAEDGNHMPWGLSSIPEDDGDSSIDDHSNSSISDSANSSFIDDLSSISGGSESASIYSNSSDRSVMSVGFGENPEDFELPIERSSNFDRIDRSIEIEHFYGESPFSKKQD